jgi:hypothetical protein
MGLHTCVHVYEVQPANLTMLDNQIKDLKILMGRIRHAIDSHHERTGQPKTIVIIVNAGRPRYEPGQSQCSWKFSRAAAAEAHKHGFAVLEREEMERRLVYRSEYSDYPSMKLVMHLDMPAQSIIATALVGLVSCLMKNQTVSQADPFSVFRPPYLPVGP